MARIFVPPHYATTNLNSDLYRFLREGLPEHVLVLLEFHSLGAQRRQVDLAVVSDYGVDVVEIKDKRGAVVASPNGAWQIRHGNGRRETIELNSKGNENPYDQAHNTARDFERWLSNSGLVTSPPANGSYVFPAVLVPQRHSDANLPTRGFVQAYNGVEELGSQLRSLASFRGSRPIWPDKMYAQLPEKLGLAELAIASVTGHIVDDEGRAVSGARVSVGEAETKTDGRGRFRVQLAEGTHTIRVQPSAPHLPIEEERHFAQGPIELSFAVERQAEAASLPDDLLERLGDLLERPDGDDIGERLDSLRAELDANLTKEKEEREILLELLAEEANAAQEQNRRHVEEAVARLAEQLGRIESALRAGDGSAPVEEDVRGLRDRIELLGDLRRQIVPYVPDPPSDRGPHRPRPQEVRIEDAEARPLPRGGRRGVWAGRAFAVTIAVAALVWMAVPQIRSLLSAPGAHAGGEAIVDGTSNRVAATSGSDAGDGTRVSAELADGVDSDAQVVGASPAQRPSKPEAGLAAGAPNDAPTVTEANAPRDQRASGAFPSSTSTSEARPLPGEVVAVDEVQAISQSLPGAPISGSTGSSSDDLDLEGMQASPLSATACPASHPIKGNVAMDGQRIFHRVGQEYYSATHPETCFASSEAAARAGFRASMR